MLAALTRAVKDNRAKPSIDMFDRLASAASNCGITGFTHVVSDETLSEMEAFASTECEKLNQVVRDASARGWGR